MDFLHHVHPVNDTPEHRKAGALSRVFSIRLRVEADLVLDHDREIARRRAGIEARHRKRSIDMAQAGLVGRLVRDRRQDALGVVLGPALEQAVGRFAPFEVHGAITDRAVEPSFLYITQEICRGDGRALYFERDGDVAAGHFKYDKRSFRSLCLWWICDRRPVLRIGGEGRHEDGRGKDRSNECHSSIVICRWQRSKPSERLFIHASGLQT